MVLRLSSKLNSGVFRLRYSLFMDRVVSTLLNLLLGTVFFLHAESWKTINTIYSLQVFNYRNCVSFRTWIQTLFAAVRSKSDAAWFLVNGCEPCEAHGFLKRSLSPQSRIHTSRCHIRHPLHSNDLLRRRCHWGLHRDTNKGLFRGTVGASVTLLSLSDLEQ